MTDLRKMSVLDLALAYREKRLSPQEVTQVYLDEIEPGPIYRVVTVERALLQAKQAEALFKQGVDLGPLQGVPIALKDLVSTKGEVTAAGSKVLLESEPAKEDAPVAARLDAAGAVFLGKTTMTELAFSGLGINPHFGTPTCALDQERVPGGSSSGSAVAVANHLACAALGSDTGGSVRIPASFNGIVGLKTSNGLIPTEGVIPLSTSLDTLGPMTRSVQDAWAMYLALRAKPYEALRLLTKKMTLLCPETLVLDDCDSVVREGFSTICQRLEAQGHRLEKQAVPEFETIFALYRRYGSFAAHESLALYEALIENRESELDPRVTKRILAFKGRPATDYLRLTYAREQLVRDFWQTYRAFDAILLPTVAILPPKLSSLAEDEAYFKANALCLRNTLLFNFLSGPAVSVPAAKTEEGLSIGLMIATPPKTDALALGIASLIAGDIEA